MHLPYHYETVVFEKLENFYKLLLIALELQKDEAEDIILEERRTFTPLTTEDTELSINHPYYDAARHGIVQLAGTFNKKKNKNVRVKRCC